MQVKCYSRGKTINRKPNEVLKYSKFLCKKNCISQNRNEDYFKNIEEEDWAYVKGFEKSLEISNKGRVRSNGKLRSIKITKNGYNSINLCINKKRYYFLVHRLVAEHFVENLEHLKYVNHIDGNKLNNDSKNLEWCTAEYNCNHAVKIGLTHNEEKHYKAKLTKEDVIEILASKDSSRTLGIRYGVNKSTIKSIKSRRTWKYVEEKKR